MSVKRYMTTDDAFLNSKGEFVKYEDYKEMSDYADSLVEFGKLPCLPKDLENLREANAQLAQENFELNEFKRRVSNMDSIAEFLKDVEYYDLTHLLVSFHEFLLKKTTKLKKEQL